MKLSLLGVILIGIGLSQPVHAQQFLQCKVVNVADGDTITCLENRTPHKIRLDGIDAPERKQAFGRKARQILSARIIHKHLRIRLYNKDRYGRFIGTLYDQHQDINAWMIEQGYAWAYRKYLKKHNKHYLSLEKKARQAQRGLWIDAKRAIYPSDFRKRKP